MNLHSIIGKTIGNKTPSLFPSALILLGVPDSGKTYFSSEYLKLFPSYVYVSLKDVCKNSGILFKEIEKNEGISIIQQIISVASSSRYDLIIEIEPVFGTDVNKFSFLLTSILANLRIQNYQRTGVLLINCNDDILGPSIRETFSRLSRFFTNWLIYDTTEKDLLLVDSSTRVDFFESIISKFNPMNKDEHTN